MKLKLTAAEFNALYSLFNHMILGATPKGFQTKLLHSILLDIYKKMYKRAIERKKKYSLPLSDQEALAFFIFFQKYPLEKQMVFEANLIHTINNSIHQKFTT